MVRADGYFSVAPLDGSHRPMLRGCRWLSKGAERDTWRRRRAVAARRTGGVGARTGESRRAEAKRGRGGAHGGTW